MRRRQAFRGKSSPVLKKTPNKGLMQVTRHRLCSTPLSRAHLSTKEGRTSRRGSGKQAELGLGAPPLPGPALALLAC